jgi:hypothetical protein
MDYGTSAKLVKFNQILNPEAERNLAPVIGFDGRAAWAVIDRYEAGFEKSPAPTFTPIFGIRGALSSTGMGAGGGYR